MVSVSVIIPTYNAEKYLRRQLGALSTMGPVEKEVLVIDSSSTDETRTIAESFSFVSLVVIPQNKFDHGGTRDLGLRLTSGRYVVFLTQDAEIEDPELLIRLVRPFEDSEVAVTYGRQIARTTASRAEKLIREFNYPDISEIRSLSQETNHDIKTFFCSNVCAAYSRVIYMTLGGFPSPAFFSEDMAFSAKALRAGYKISYVADAKVTHSHDFSLVQQFRRNYAIGYSLRNMQRAVGLMEVPSGEGLRMVKFVLTRLFKERRILACLSFLLDVAARGSGFYIGLIVHYSKGR